MTSNIRKKTARHIRITVGIVLFFVVVLIAAGNFMLYTALRPDDNVSFSKENAFERLFTNYPDTKQWIDSLEQAHALRDTFIMGEGSYRIHAFYVKAASDTASTAIIVHGYTDCAIKFMYMGKMYHEELGMNILMPDLHYHGESEGAAIQMGWLDRLDVMRWIDVAHNIFGSASMVVHGVSMGAATVMMLSGEPLPSYVKCLVEDCGYTSVWDEFSHELKNRYGLPSFPILNVTNLLCKWKMGWSFREASAWKQVQKCELPMLFIHGDSDTFVPSNMVYPLYVAKPYPKELWITKGVAHAASYRNNPSDYTEHIRKFTQKHMQDLTVSETTNE